MPHREVQYWNRFFLVESDIVHDMQEKTNELHINSVYFYIQYKIKSLKKQISEHKE